MTYSAEVLADSPLVYWRLGDASGTTMTDSSGNARHGTYTNTPTLAQTGALAGDADTAVLFTSGLTQKGQIADAAWMDVSSLTVEAWIKSTATGTRAIIDRDDGTVVGRRPFQFRMNAGKLEFLRVNNAAGATAVVTATGAVTINNGAWHHVVATYDGTTIRLYVDGAADGTATASGGIVQPTSAVPLTVAVNGVNQGGFAYMTGTLDEAAYYGTVLSSTRILAHYNAGINAGTTVNGGQATETDSALTGSVTVGAAVAGGQATETDTALTGTVKVGAIVSGGQATETDAALTGSVVSGTTITGGQAAETDSALTGSVVAGSVVTGGQATETDEALTGSVDTGGLNVAGGQALETDEARGGIVIQPSPTNEGDGNGRDRDGYATSTWEPAVVAPPAGEAAAAARVRMHAHAYTDVSLDGRPHLVGHITKEQLRRRTRILVDGRDVTFLNGMATPEPTYSLISPLLYGSGSISFPQYPAFLYGSDAVPAWLKVGAPVVIQRVNEAGVVTGTSYRGFLLDTNINGRDLTFGLGGEAQGRLALIDVPPRITRKRNKLEFWWDSLIHDVHLPVGNSATTGIVLQNRGGMDGMTLANEYSANGAKRGGAVYTCMPNSSGEYRVVQKDKTTITGTVYFDDAHTRPDLRRDPAEEPNRIYATAVNKNGRRIRFADTPLLQEQKPLDFPSGVGSSFSEGTTDADTDGGITRMIARLVWSGYLDSDDRPGGYDSDVTDAITELQDRAGLTQTGDMNHATWEALFDMGISGPSIRGTQIRPAVQRSKVRRYNRTGSGAVIGPNPDYDRSVLPIDASPDFGTGITVNQTKNLAREYLHDAEASNWVGEIVLTTGAVIEGEHTPGDPIVDLMDARQLKPGMNLWAPLFDGGTLFHVSGCRVSAVDGLPQVTVQVDTRFRDTMAVAEIIARNRDSRRDPARNWMKNYRSSGRINDVVSEWDSIGGVLPDDIRLQGDRWTVIGIPAGQEGTVQRIRLLFSDPCEYSVALFGKKIEASKLDHRLGNPLSPSDKANWLDENILDDLDDNHFLLGKWGDDEQPCGYWPVAKSDGGELNSRGKFQDDAGIAYFAFDDASLWLAIYPAQDTTLKAGRILKNQLEAGS